jgi:NADPH-dependent curcumin reductase CurA
VDLGLDLDVDLEAGAQREELNTKVVFAKRPDGIPDEQCFRVEHAALTSLEPGQVRVDVSHLSIDAFIRTTLEDISLHPSVPIGGTIGAIGVGQVRESASERFAPGQSVVGYVGAQSIATVAERELRRIDEKRAPLTAHLGVLGLSTGMTSYFGIREVGHVKPGETVVVSAAAGAVGSVAAQIATIDGGRVIGIAGSKDKCRFLTEALGLAAAIDYKSEDVAARLRSLAPDGIDVYFDNVGGPLLDVILDQIREQARIVICGAISQYHGDMSQGVRGPNLYLRLAERHARMEGFAVNHFSAQFREAEAQLAEWLAAGRLQLPEHVEHGLENFAATLRMLFEGGHTGKLLLAV